MERRVTWWLWVIVIYAAGFLLFTRGASFNDPRPGDHLIAGIFWPLITVSAVWRVWTKQARVTWHWGRKKR